MIRYFIIIIETAIIAYILLKNNEFNQLLERFLNALPSSTELKSWLLKGISFGTLFAVGLLGLLLIGIILYYLTPYIKTILDKDTLIENWEEEFARAKQAEINQIENLKQEAQKKLQEAQKREQELKNQITYYQRLSQQLRQKEIELELKFQRKRESYLQELSGLQRKNKEFQSRIKRLKEQLKSCREKLRRCYDSERSRRN